MNIILIAIDTLRADHLGCYGYGRQTSPALDALAEDGIVFENFFAPAIPTDPSFASLFTGLADYGHRIAGVIPPRRIPEEAPWLPALLTDAGYHTCAVDNLHGHAELFGDGFAERRWPGMGSDKEARVKRNAELISAAAVQMLDDLPGGRPFFQFVHYWDPHTPYWPPEPYSGMFYEGDPRDPSKTSMLEVRAGPFVGWGWIDEDITDAGYVCAQYDAEIAYNSEHLGAFLEELKARDLYDESLIVAFSDHGEVLDRHEGYFDHHGLYDDNIHVPLIVKLPGAEHAGARVEPMVQMLDLPPTLLRLAGADAPADMCGKDLLAVAQGEAGYENLFLAEGTWQVKRGVRTRDWKLIRAASDTPLHNWHGTAVRELYNLAKDPDEQTNLINVERDVACELERRLEKWLLRMHERYGWPDPLVEDGPTLRRKQSPRSPTPAAEIR